MAGNASRQGEGEAGPPARGVPEVEVEVRGDVPPDSAEYARTMVRAVARHSREPVLSARVRLTQGKEPGVRRSAVARANMDVNGQPARARVAAETMYEAIDLLRGRLDYRLARLEHWTVARGAAGGPLRVARPRRFDCPVLMAVKTRHADWAERRRE